MLWNPNGSGHRIIVNYLVGHTDIRLVNVDRSSIKDRIRASMTSRSRTETLVNFIQTLGIARLSALALTGLVSAPTAGLCQSQYPVRTITLIVPFAAGGPTDTVARIVSPHMATTLGQQIIIENVVGSGGTTAAIRAMRSPPDGYTIMMGHMGTHGAAVALYPNLAYNPADDFEPIGMAAGMPVLILARKDLGPTNLLEFVAYLRNRPAPLTMAHAGLGSVSFATCLLLNSMIDTHPTMVSFQGTGPAMNALVAGRIDYMCDQIVSAVPRVQSGAVKAYAIANPHRSATLPDVPTTAEAGLPKFRVSAWNALFAPKGSAPGIINRLNAALSLALDDPATRNRLLELGSEIPGGDERTPAALARLVRNEIDNWKPVTQAATTNH
jgi:tripartite-type tricarboxylate transporter receptor subunit TctC